MNNTAEPNGWNKWSMWVLRELERLGTCIKELESAIDAQDKRIDLLEQAKVINESTTKKRSKSSFWGVLGGGGLVAIIELIRYLVERYGGN